MTIADLLKHFIYSLNRIECHNHYNKEHITVIVKDEQFYHFKDYTDFLDKYSQCEIINWVFDYSENELSVDINVKVD